jgi:uncharacterized protein YcbX
MFVKELWRYPVKSMAGERLEHVQLDKLGFAGDRKVLVVDSRGHVATSRTFPELLGLKAVLGPENQPLINGYPWNSPDALALVHKAVNRNAELIEYEGPERFDVLPLLVATDGAITDFGHDSRRLRSNIVVGGVEGLDERSWPGKSLRINNALIGIQDLRGRCVMTTFDPDTLKQDTRILKEIVQKFGGKLALNCFVIRGGTLNLGDSVELLAQLPSDLSTRP